MRMIEKYLLSGVFRNAESGGGGAGAGGGAAAPGGAGAGGAGAGGAGEGGAAAAAAAVDNGPWYAHADYGFDDDTKRFFEGKNYPDAKTALSSLRHADQVARDRNVLSKPDPAKMNDWEGWETLGWKKDLKDYVVTKPKLKAGQVLDEAMYQSFTQDAHELKLPLDRVTELFNRQFSKAHDRIDAITAAGATAAKDLETGLRSEWGDKYDANVDLAKRAMKAFGVGMDDSAELESAIGSSRLVKMFHGIADRLGEDNLVTNEGGSVSASHPATIEAELNRFEQDPANQAILRDERHPLYQQTLATRRGMIEKLAVAQKGRSR